MKDARPMAILFLFSLVPYAAVAWAYMKLTDGDTGDFWTALIVLIAARWFFAAIEALGNVLTWRAYGRRLMISRQLEFLRSNGFPKRAYAHDDYTEYLARIEEDDDFPAALRTAAHESRFGLAIYQSLGGLRGIRMHAAAEAALEIHSPKSEAPTE